MTGMTGTIYTEPLEDSVVATGVCKAFTGPDGQPVQALNAVSLRVRRGQMTALVGPDGAGKTTLMRMMAGLMVPDAGQLQVLGVDVAQHPQQVQDQISYMPQRFGLYEDLSVQENLDLYADLHGVPQAERHERFARLLKMMDMDRFTARPAGKLSGGMKQKLGLACTLVRSPALLLLDEPSVGVDPLSRRDLWEILLQLVRDERLSVVVNTAYMDEAERCARVHVMSQGRVLAEGTPAELARRADGLTFVADPPPGEPARMLQARLIDASALIADAVPRGGAVRFIRYPQPGATVRPGSMAGRGAGDAALNGAGDAAGRAVWADDGAGNGHGDAVRNGAGDAALSALLAPAVARPRPAELEDAFMLLLREQAQQQAAQAGPLSGKEGLSTPAEVASEQSGPSGAAEVAPGQHGRLDMQKDGSMAAQRGYPAIRPAGGEASPAFRADANPMTVRPAGGKTATRPDQTGSGADATRPGAVAPEKPVILVRDLVRRFGDFTAVASTSFEVRRGEIFGLLGPNGAGKTTTFRMLCGLLPATSGTLEVAGNNLRVAPGRARARLGYVAQKFSLYGSLSVRENLEFYGAAYGLHGRRLRARVTAVMQQFGLEPEAISGMLPAGYRQRLAMAAGLVHEPEVLFLDEPTSGIDPLARRSFWRTITALAESGVTIVITTHFMEEAEYCDRMAIQDAGRMLALGTPQQVREQAGAAGDDMNSAFIAIVEQARGDTVQAAAGAHRPPEQGEGGGGTPDLGRRDGSGVLHGPAGEGRWT